MKKIIGILFLLLSVNCFALTGKQEFVVIYEDGELRFINDGNRLVVLEVTSAGLTQAKNIKCGVAPLNGNEAQFGPNHIVFLPNHGMVNKKVHYYENNKTDLLFINDLCPKLPKEKRNNKR